MLYNISDYIGCHTIIAYGQAADGAWAKYQFGRHVFAYRLLW